MAVPLLLFFIMQTIKYFENQNIKNILYLTVLLFLIFFLHFQMSIYCVLYFTLAFIYNFRKSYSYILKYVIIVLPLIIIMYIVYSIDTTEHGQSLLPFFYLYYKNSFLNTVPERMRILPVMDNFYFIEGVFGALAALIFASTIVVPVFLFLFKRFKIFYDKIINDRYSYYLFIFISSSFLCYFFLPDIIPGQYLVYQRFSVLFMLALNILGSYCYRNLNLSGIFKSIIIFVLAFHFVIVSIYYNDFKVETKNFTEDIFPEDASCRRISGIIYTNTFKGRPVYIHFPMYFIVWKKGISTGLVDYRFGAVKRKAGFDQLPYYREWIGDSRNYSDEYKNLEYILLKDSLKLQINGFENTKIVDDWYLYTNSKLLSHSKDSLK